MNPAIMEDMHEEIDREMDDVIQVGDYVTWGSHMYAAKVVEVHEKHFVVDVGERFYLRTRKWCHEDFDTYTLRKTDLSIERRDPPIERPDLDVETYEARTTPEARGDKPTAVSKVLGVQEGGDHYKGQTIQPVEYISANELDFFEGNVVKYITRHSTKGGAKDIRKVIHYAEMILAMEYGETYDREVTEACA